MVGLLRFLMSAFLSILCIFFEWPPMQSAAFSSNFLCSSQSIRCTRRQWSCCRQTQHNVYAQCLMTFPFSKNCLFFVNLFYVLGPQMPHNQHTGYIRHNSTAGMIMHGAPLQIKPWPQRPVQLDRLSWVGHWSLLWPVYHVPEVCLAAKRPTN